MAWHAFGTPTSGSPVPRAGRSGGPFEGRDAVFGQFRRLAADWERQRISDVEAVADRAGWVVLTFRWEVQGVRSGFATATQMAASFRVKDGRISDECVGGPLRDDGDRDIARCEEKIGIP